MIYKQEPDPTQFIYEINKKNRNSDVENFP